MGIYSTMNNPFFIISIDVQPKFKKKVKNVKNKKECFNIWNKMEEVANTLETNPNYYKNLHKPLQEYK